ncbi:hypothetical protein D3C72_1611570 [compost metagenome]
MLLALGDLRLQCLQLLQIGRQRGDALRTLALQVAVIGQRTVGIGHRVLRKQQLQRRVVAKLIGGAQQARQFAILFFQVGLQCIAPLLGLGQRLGLLTQCRLGLGQRATAARDFFIGLAQLLRRLSALALDLPAFLRHALQLAAQLLQLALGLAGRSGLGRARQWQRQGKRHSQQQATSTAQGGDVMPA